MPCALKPRTCTEDYLSPFLLVYYLIRAHGLQRSLLRWLILQTSKKWQEVSPTAPLLMGWVVPALDLTFHLKASCADS